MLRGAVQMIIVVMVICLRIHMNVECVYVFVLLGDGKMGYSVCVVSCDYVGLYMVGTLNAFLANVFVYFYLAVIMLGCIWLALSMHFRRGICILFWSDYVGLYMVGTLNAFSAKNLYTFISPIIGLYMVGTLICNRQRNHTKKVYKYLAENALRVPTIYNPT